MAASASNQALDRLVFSYLEKRQCVMDGGRRAEGVAAQTTPLAAPPLTPPLSFLPRLTAAAAAMKGEAARSLAAAGAPPPPPPADGGLAVGLLAYLDAGDPTPPAALASQFDALAEWVDASLDAFRPELARVLYPLCAHACLALAERGEGTAAASLLATHKARFVDAGGRGSRARAAELAALAGAAAGGARGGAAAAARAARYPVTLCRLSFDLLTHHLRAAGLTLMLALLNERVALRVREGQPAPAGGPGADEPSLLTGALEGDAATVNATPLMLALLKDPAAAAREGELAAEADAAAAAGPDGKPLTKKARLAAQRAAEREKARRAKAAAAAVESEDVPLPDVDSAAVDAGVADLRARAPVDAAHPPTTIMLTFVNTAASLNCVALAADASLAVGGCADGSVRVHRLDARPDPDAGVTGVTKLLGHSGAVYAVDIGPQARLAFSGGADGALRAWSLAAAAPVAAYRGHLWPIWAVAACPRGAYVATGGADRAARVWSTERAAPLRTLAGHVADVTAVAWHPNCHYVASGSDDASVRLWDVRSGGAARVLPRHRAPVTSLAFSHDGLSLASGDEDGGLLVWDLAAGAARRAAPSAHDGAVWALAWAHGPGGALASGGADDAVRVWDAGAGAAPHGGAAAAVPPPAAAAAGKGGPPPPSLLPKFADYRTKATPVIAVRFTGRNLLAASGALTLA